MKAATGEVVTAEELGGGDVHTRISGVADHLAEDDAHALALARRIVAQPQPRQADRRSTCASRASRCTTRAELYGVIPADTRQPYDVREVIARIVDGSRVRRVQAALRRDAGLRLRAHLRLSGRHPRQQRHPVLGVRAQGRAFHRAVRAARHPAAVPAEHHRLHGRAEVRARRHRQGRRQDGRRRSPAPRCRSSP